MPRTDHFAERIGAVFLPEADTVEVDEDTTPKPEGPVGYGFDDPAAAPDLWLKDDPGNPGSASWAGTFWNSPDLWIRNADDGGTTHQPVEYGQDNWFHARIRNRSATATARHFVVTFNVKAFANLAVFDLVASDWFVLPLVLDRIRVGRARRVALELLRPRRWPRLEAVVLPPKSAMVADGPEPIEGLDGLAYPAPGPAAEPLDCGGCADSVPPEHSVVQDNSVLPFPPGPAATIPIRLPARGQITVGVGFRAPRDARPGEVIHLDLLQREGRGQRVTGGVAVELRINGRGEAP